MPHPCDRSTHRPVVCEEHTVVQTRESEFFHRRCFVP